MATTIEREPEWVPTAPIVVSNARRIDAPADAVWDRIADHESWTEWFTAVQKVSVTLGAEGVDGGRQVWLPGATVRERFTAWEPPTRFAFTITDGPRALASMAELIEIEPDGNSCTITYTQGIEPAKGFGWFWRIAARRMNRQMRKALDNLAALVTGSG